MIPVVHETDSKFIAGVVVCRPENDWFYYIIQSNVRVEVFILALRLVPYLDLYLLEWKSCKTIIIHNTIHVCFYRDEKCPLLLDILRYFKIDVIYVFGLFKIVPRAFVVFQEIGDIEVVEAPSDVCQFDDEDSILVLLQRIEAKWHLRNKIIRPAHGVFGVPFV